MDTDELALHRPLRSDVVDGRSLRREEFEALLSLRSQHWVLVVRAEPIHVLAEAILHRAVGKLRAVEVQFGRSEARIERSRVREDRLVHHAHVDGCDGDVRRQGLGERFHDALDGGRRREVEPFRPLTHHDAVRHRSEPRPVAVWPTRVARVLGRVSACAVLHGARHAQDLR